MSCEKHKEVLLNVLEAYRDMPHLWQKSNKYYCNNERRTEGYRVLLEIYRSFDEKATLKTFKKKLINMRTSYNRELAKVNTSNETGKNYVPTLWYFDDLKFLGSMSEPCHKTSKSIEDEEDSNSFDEYISSHQIRSIASTPSVKRKKKLLLQNPKRIIKPPEVMLSNKEDEDWAVFGKYVGLQLRDINGMQLIFTQKIISDVIYNAKLGRLSEDSCLLVTLSELRPTMSSYKYDMPSEASNYSSPSPDNRQSPDLPLKRPSSRKYPSDTCDPLSSTAQYYPSPCSSESPRYQSQLVQLQQHTNQSPQQTISSPQHTIEFTENVLQSPQHSLCSKITVNNAEDFLEKTEIDLGSTISPTIIKGNANVTKEFLIIKPNIK